MLHLKPFATDRSVSIHGNSATRHQARQAGPRLTEKTYGIESVRMATSSRTTGWSRETHVLSRNWCGGLSDDFDQIAIVVDWLDACRRRDLDALLELYAEGASVECHCSGTQRHEGLAALAAYWRPQLER